MLGLIGMVLSVVHLAGSTGFGTGGGRAGAIVALVLAVIGIGLGGLALARSRGRGRCRQRRRLRGHDRETDVTEPGAGVRRRSRTWSGLSSLRQLLKRPLVAVGVVDINEPAPWLFVDFARIDAAADQFVASRVGVLYDEQDHID